MFNASVGSDLLYAGVTLLENGNWIESYKSLIESAEAQTRRRLLQLQTCRVLTTFVTSAVQSARVAETHFKYNIPRAACRLVNNTKEKGVNDCPPSSWVLATTTMPPSPKSQAAESPPPPSPPLFAFPPPRTRGPSSIGVKSDKLRQVSVLQTGVLDALSYLTGTDIPQFIERCRGW